MIKRQFLAPGMVLPGLVLLFFLSSLAGCSGCSKSGIRSHSSKAGKMETRDPVSTNEPGNDEIPAEDELVSEPGSSGNLPLNELFKKCKPAVFLIKTSDGQNIYQGTGFFISPGGIAISNFHLFEGKISGKEEIQLADGSQPRIKEILARNSDEDYIIFQVGITRPANYLPVASLEPEVGEEVFAIGNPHGLEHTLSQGIVSGYRQEKMLIQTTAEIAQGSSGGPLMNLQGEVVGITSSTLGEANLNFAVNINLLYLSRFLQEE